MGSGWRLIQTQSGGTPFILEGSPLAVLRLCTCYIVISIVICTVHSYAVQHITHQWNCLNEQPSQPGQPGYYRFDLH